MPFLQWKDLQESQTRSAQESESCMILTTSRRPTTKSRQLCRELKSVIPLSQYILRGKKGIRDLISLSVEKGADRIVVVTSRGNEPCSFIFYAEWVFLGELRGVATLRRELGIPKIHALEEDVPFLLKSSEKSAKTIAGLFGAQLCNGDDSYTFMTYENGWIDFYRLDISHQPVGPRIKVEKVHENHY